MPPTSEVPMPQASMAVGPGTVSLSVLIDFIVQRTFHEMTVLSEILPRKTDMERKIDIVQFASRTRQLFIRLLALVKWANSASKVDKCVEICNFLEQQSMFFIETADFLHRMSRETLVNARLPNFSLPCAIDVLTTGTYPRLPKCIREKIVPPDPITTVEKKTVLQRLNQVIQYRLVSCELPQHMRKLNIENGRVKFMVENEFEVTLTLMEDSPVIPWRLLDIDILVEDKETSDGNALVHSLQVAYIHRVAQSRLLNNDKPLHDLYRVLHSFCQSLQLEVLNSQAQKLIRERLCECLAIEEYSVGKFLTVSYWKDQLKNKEKPQDGIRYKLCVHVNEEDDGKQLCISHTPAMTPEECRQVGLTIQSEHLSIETLLMQTIEVRTGAKLKELAIGVQKYIEGKCEIKDMPLALHVPILYPCMASEQLRITVDGQRGVLQTSLPSLEHAVLQELEDSLNGPKKNFQKSLLKLRLQLTMLRCERSVSCLNTVARNLLPIINEANHPLNSLPKDRLYITVPKQTDYHVVVSLDDLPPRSVQSQYHLLETTPCLAESVDINEENPVMSFLKAGKLIPLDTLAFTSGPCTEVFNEPKETEIDNLNRKRRLFLGEYQDQPGKKQKMSPYFVSELVHIVAAAEEKLPFIFLSEELKQEGILSTNIQVDKEAVGLMMDIIQFPDVAGVEKVDCDALRRAMLSCKLRMTTKPVRSWVIEFMYTSSRLKTQTPVDETGPTQRVLSMYEMTSDYQKTTKEMINEWTAMCHLYSIVSQFKHSYNDPQTGLQKIIQIKSYNYRRLCLLYGHGFNSLASIQWKCDKKQFVLMFGRQGRTSTMNPHIVMTTQLQQDLNHTRDLVCLVQVLHDTWSPMNSLQKLSSAVILGVGTSPKVSTQSFTVIPQSSTHVRISYRNNYCLDVHLRSNNIVAVRDGAYSLFDTGKVTEGFTPIPMLKAFLGMFVDESVTASNVRRRSATEDDNPPSPVMDNIDVFNISQGHSTGSPGQRPRTDIVPSPSTFIGTPSPSTILAAGSPGPAQLPVPSPTTFVPAPSPSSLGIHMQSPASSFISPQGLGDSGSPYPSTNLAMPSPGQRNWPNSPSVQGPSPASRHGMGVASPGNPSIHSPQTQVMSPPSRILPQRQWAASTPTLLSHTAFDTLLKPSQIQPLHVALSPLERFLGCKLIRRHIVRVFNSQDKNLTNIPTTEVGVNIYKGEYLQYCFALNTSTLQSLHMKVQPLAEYKDQWSQEEIQIFEKYFDLKVACPPYKPNSLTAFIRLFRANINILKDVIQIMRLELMPSPDRKWTVQLLLTVPPRFANMAPAGTPAIVVVQKMILMLQLTRFQGATGQQQTPQMEPMIITIPLLYNIQENNITLVESDTISITPSLQQISQHLKRFMEVFHSQQTNECAIFPAVRELVQNFGAPS